MLNLLGKWKKNLKTHITQFLEGAQTKYEHFPSINGARVKRADLVNYFSIASERENPTKQFWQAIQHANLWALLGVS